MLPVSGLTLRVREPTGADELVVLEPARSPVATVVTLADRVTTGAAGETPAWAELPAADVGAIALTIRQAWLGERISTDTSCPGPACQERMDIEFTIPAYLAHHRPRRYSGVQAGQEAGWFELAGPAVSFRLPTIGDLQAAATSADPERCLRERCVRPAAVPAAVARRVSRAMTALAPSLTETITARCPACGGDDLLRFDPVAYPLAELRDAAGGLYEEVHLLASAFGWPEDTILALPRGRRIRYADLIRRQRAAA
ncbi:MAG TPA: hypothetical protein VKG80_00100 [Trebonia sp.]|nr:hypothetical protein [Trebonia sp.]